MEEITLSESEIIASNHLLDDFDSLLKRKYKLTIQEVTPSKSKGYWIINKECGGIKGGCKHPMHTFIGCEDSTNHTISYYDPLKGKNGKFQSIYKTWKAHRDFLGMV